MTTRVPGFLFICLMVITFFFESCKTGGKSKRLENFHYGSFKDSLQKESVSAKYDTSNIFDANIFIPGVDSLDTLLIKMDTAWRKEIARLEHMDSLLVAKKKGDTASTAEKETAKFNLKVLDSFLKNRTPPVELSCREKDCLLFAEIIKSSQTLYLYIDGEIQDSFKVSTGKGKYETPELNLRPSGPVFIKYTSRKFPGGNYQGLGNMPYAVFLRGGYAIHGTTPGNFPKLGTKASHGCIRLHPDNAKIFNELVKVIGLENTWVSVKDSL